MIKVFEKLYWIGIDYFNFLRFLKSHRIIRKCCNLKYLPSEVITTEVGRR